MPGRDTRVSFLGRIGGARIPIQVDVGFGDSSSSPPVEIEFPSLLEMPLPLLRAYRMETTVAEKFDAMLSLGILNSRMKDYFDLWFLCRHFAFDGSHFRGCFQIRYRLITARLRFSNFIPVRRQVAFEVHRPVQLAKSF